MGTRRSKRSPGNAGPSESASPGGDGAVEDVNPGLQVAHIKNKVVRARALAKVRLDLKHKRAASRRKRKAETEAALEEGREPPAKRVPRTQEAVREADDTWVEEGDEEVEADEEQDEFSAHFQRGRPPKVLLTTSRGRRSDVLSQLLIEMLAVFPVAIFYERRQYPLKKIVQYAINEGFSDLVVFNEDRKIPNAMLVIHLPHGPTALFKIVKFRLRKDIHFCGEPTSHKPELIMNNFNTRLGHRVGRMIASLFSQDPQFRGRQAVTFHNQRDYVFMRHHRYVFEEKEKEKDGVTVARLKARLQELGPRMTLKVVSLQKGTFDSKNGEYEWVLNKDMKTSKKRFFL
eukprot:evm.model.scf_418.11 EVM.evm.TU.scf_418.11   scf_418:63716-65102(+)